MVLKDYERVMCERWVGDWTKIATYWPPALLAITALLSRSPVLLNRGLSLCRVWFSLLRTATTDSKLWSPTNWLPVAPGYIIIWRSPASVSVASAPNSTRQDYPLISSTGCTSYLHRCISNLTARPGRRSICYTLFCLVSLFNCMLAILYYLCQSLLCWNSAVVQFNP